MDSRTAACRAARWNARTRACGARRARSGPTASRRGCVSSTSSKLKNARTCGWQAASRIASRAAAPAPPARPCARSRGRSSGCAAGRHRRLEAVLEIPDRRRAAERRLQDADEARVVALADEARRACTASGASAVGSTDRGCDRTRRRAAACVRSRGTRRRPRRGTPPARVPTPSSRGRSGRGGGARRSSVRAAPRTAPASRVQYVARVRLVPDDDRARVGDERERTPRVPAEPRLRRGVRRRVACRSRRPRARPASASRRLLSRARARRAAPRSARASPLPRHPDAHGVHAERRAASERRRAGRDVHLSVSSSTPTSSCGARRAAEREPRRAAATTSSSAPAISRRLIRALAAIAASTRQPVATTVRR